MLRRLTFAVIGLSAVFAPLAASATISPDNGYGDAGMATIVSGCSTAHVRGSTPYAGFGGRVYVIEECGAGYSKVYAVGDNGDLDTSYGTNGHVTFQIPAACRGEAPRLVPARDGSVYGVFWGVSTPKGSSMPTDLHVCAVRITPSGDLATSFGGHSAVRRLDRPSDRLQYLTGAAVDAHGRLVVFTERSAGYWQYSAAFVNRYAVNGRPDLSFSSDGQRAYQQRYYDSLQWGGVIGDKPVLAVRSWATSDSDIPLNTTFVRFTATGGPDPTFSGDGKVLVRSTDIGGGRIGGSGIVVDEHNRITYVAQQEPVPYHDSLWLDLRRIGPTGADDAAFAAATAKIRPPSNTKIEEPSLEASAGKYLVTWTFTGTSNNPTRITGFNGNGARWLALGANGTTAHSAWQFAPDRAAFYEFDELTGEGPDQVHLFRRLVQ